MKHRFNFRMGIFSVCILLLVSLTACAGPAQHAQDQGGQDADALHLAEYAAYIGLPRAQALDALARIGGAGVGAQAVATPAEAGCGCGLSVRFDARFYPVVRRIVLRRGYSAFAGFFRAANGGYLRV